MTAEALVEQAVALAESSGSVAPLRALAVDLATAGRLTVQSEADGSGADLLQQLASQRQRLVEAGKIRQRPVRPLAPHERPFDAPANWAWCRLFDVGHELGQRVPAEAFTYIDVGGIDAARGVISERVEVVSPKDAPSRARKLVSRGTVIYSTVRPYLLNVAIVEQEYSPPPIASTAFGILHPFDGVDRRYLFYWLRSRYFTAYVQAGMKGMAYPAINDDKFYSGPIALPPLAEQKRIVAKVGELMALCDRLEAQQQQREHAHAALTRAALARFADAPTVENLEYLFHRAFKVAPTPLRESILSAALSGRLTVSTGADGDSSALLSAITLERSASGHRTPEGSDPADDDSPLYELPARWTWTTLGRIALRIQYGYTASADPSITDVRMLRITDIQNNRVDWPSVPGCQIASDEAKKYLLEPNDILIARTGGTIGKSFIVPEVLVKSVFASYLIRVTPPRAMDARYLKLVLESPLYWRQITRMSAGTGQPNVNGQALGRLLIPLPPLAEQLRIVAKVNALMALVDRLEADLAAARATGEKLMDAVVAELTS